MCFFIPFCSQDEKKFERRILKKNNKFSSRKYCMKSRNVVNFSFLEFQFIPEHQKCLRQSSESKIGLYSQR